MVEAVEPGSALARAGLMAGDVLRGWQRSGALLEQRSTGPVVAAKREAGGEIGSPFDWAWFLVEQTPRGGAKLLVERQGATVEIEMGAGPWSADVLPSLPPRLAPEAARAAGLERRGAKGEAAAIWSTLAARPEGAAAGTASDLLSWIELRTGTLWAAAREWDRAIAALRHGLDAASTPRARIELLRALAGAQRGARQFDAARDSYAVAIALAEASWGESLEVVNVLGKLAGLDWEQGRVSAASERWRRALAITERLAPASLYAAQILSNLGSAATSQSDLAAGEKDSRAALAIVEALGLRSELVGPLNNLAIVAYKRGDLDAAAALYRRCLESREAQDDAVAASILNNLAEVATLQGDLGAAQAHLERARSIWERLAPASPNLADVLASLGQLASDRGDLDLAQGYVQEGAAIREQLQPGSVHDPLGFRVFSLARSAVRRSLELGELHVLAGDLGVRNDTLLGFGTAPDVAPAAKAVLRGPVSSWNDELLPDLVTAHGKAKAEIAEGLRQRIMSLRKEDVEGFRFKDLVDALKSDVRSRWAELLRDPRLDVELEVDALASFAGVVQCVDAALDRLETDERSRGYLKTVWRFLWLRASEAEAGDSPPATARPPAAAETPADGRLSQRRVAELLHLPRERLPEIYRTLGRLLAGCRDCAGEGANRAPARPPAAEDKTAAARDPGAGGRQRGRRPGAHHHLEPAVTEDAG